MTMRLRGLLGRVRGRALGSPGLGTRFGHLVPTTPGLGVWLYCSVMALPCLTSRASARPRAGPW